MPDALTSRSAVESRHVTKRIAAEAGSYNEAATRHRSSKSAPPVALFVGAPSGAMLQHDVGVRCAHPNGIPVENSPATGRCRSS